MCFFRLTCIFISGIIFMLSVAVSAQADIYRYKDENGIWHFSNIKQNRHYKPYLQEKTGKPLRSKQHSGKKFDNIILLASKQFQVESAFIKAIIRAESDFDHRAVSHKGAQGLMQLMPKTADQLNVADPFDPEENVLGGARYLSMLLKRFKNDKILALAAYNAGPTEVETRNGVPPFPETRDFIKKVMAYYKAYRSTTK